MDVCRFNALHTLYLFCIDKRDYFLMYKSTVLEKCPWFYFGMYNEKTR